MHEGHRQRMLERLEKAEDTLDEHELLEILLYNAIPRKNTNEIAHRLLSSFGSLGAIFRAGTEQLMAVGGVGESTAAYLRCIGLFYEKMEFGDDDLPSAFSYNSFSQYLLAHFKDAAHEYVEFYALDSSDRIKYHVRYTSSEADKVSVAPEDVSRFFASCRPSAVIVVHNHLCNSSSPSSSDDLFTEQVQMFCVLNGAEFYDHIIVSSAGLYSYHLERRLDTIKQVYNTGIFGAKLKS